VTEPQENGSCRQLNGAGSNPAGMNCLLHVYVGTDDCVKQALQIIPKLVRLAGRSFAWVKTGACVMVDAVEDW